jgi:hypothetical protein
MLYNLKKGYGSSLYSRLVFLQLNYEEKKMQSEYLAYVAISFLGYGGTWCRHKNTLDAVNKVVKTTMSDWYMMDFDGMELNVYIYDITGMDKITMSMAGVFCVDKEPSVECKPLETVKVKIPKLKGGIKRNGPTHRRLIEEAIKKAYPQ